MNVRYLRNDLVGGDLMRPDDEMENKPLEKVVIDDEMKYGPLEIGCLMLGLGWIFCLLYLSSTPPYSVHSLPIGLMMWYALGSMIVLAIMQRFLTWKESSFRDVDRIVAAIMMVIYAGLSITLAVLITLGYNPLGIPTTRRFRIALVTFAILQIPIAAMRLTWFRDMLPSRLPVYEAVSQMPAVGIAHVTGGWLETLFFD